SAARHASSSKNKSGGMPMAPRTLLEMSGAQLQPPGLGKAALVLIDYQNEYLTGALPLVGGREAVQEASRLLEAARSAGGQIIHVVHKGGRGGLFDREDQRGQIVDELAPRRGEV